MNLFLDTEFTSLQRPQLISLALVAENGNYVYVELDDWEESNCTPFVVEFVLPLLDGNRVNRGEARRRVATFIDRFKCPTIWNDAPQYDPSLLQDLIGSDVAYRIETIGTGQLAAGVWNVMDLDQYGRLLEAELAKEGVRRHHALDDAKAAAAAWRDASRIEKHDALSPMNSIFKSPPV